MQVVVFVVVVGCGSGCSGSSGCSTGSGSASGCGNGRVLEVVKVVLETAVVF